MRSFFRKMFGRTLFPVGNDRASSGPADGARKGILRSLRGSRGQVGVILILVIAIGLIFYAVVLNMGRVSQVKTLTMIAANTMASQMASLMASYGQKIFEEQLGGEREVCGWTALFTALITVIVIIIVIIIIIVTWGAASPLLSVVALVMACIALVLAVVNLVLQLTVVQPGITSMWNKMMSDSLNITDNLIERGIQTGLQGVVTDNMNVPDLYDADNDGVFGWIDDSDISKGAKDWIPRFAWYNTIRLSGVTGPTSDAIEQFQAELCDFLYGAGTGKACDKDGWGLHDPIECPGNDCCNVDDPVNPSPAECDPCCVPPTLDGDPIRPPCCTAGGADKCGNPVTCGARSTYMPLVEGPDATMNYQWTFDGIFAEGSKKLKGVDGRHKMVEESTVEDWMDASYSFRELLGRDDEHRMYRVNIGDVPRTSAGTGRQMDLTRVGSLPAPYGEPGYVDGDGFTPTRDPLGGETGYFAIQDATGYYEGTDNKIGIFSFFYKLSDWGTSLRDLDLVDADRAQNPDFSLQECHWCDPDGGTDPLGDGTGRCPDPNPLNFEPYPAAIPRLALTLDPTVPAQTQYSGGWCVDKENTGAVNQPPQLLDIVPRQLHDILPNRYTPVIAEDTVCAHLAADPTLDPPQLGWKRGGDKFCGDRSGPGEPRFPYGLGCLKNGGYNNAACQGSYTDPDGTVHTFAKDCECGEGVAQAPVGAAPNTPQYNWPDDVLDNLSYGLPEFIHWAEYIINTDPKILKDTFDSWYDEAADWFEPGCPSAPDPMPLSFCPASFTKLMREGDYVADPDNAVEDQDDGGVLYIWRREMETIQTPLSNWVSYTNDDPTWDPAAPDPAKFDFQYSSPSCNITGPGDGAWCVPPPQVGLNEYNLNECGCVNLEEVLTFDVNNNGVRGDLEDVVACLDYNANGPRDGVDIGGNPVTVLGNAEKFDLCATVCNQQNCENLPRSLVPNFCADFMPFTAPNPGDTAAIALCLNNGDPPPPATIHPWMSSWLGCDCAAPSTPECVNYCSVAECARDCAPLNVFPYTDPSGPYQLPAFVAPDVTNLETTLLCSRYCGQDDFGLNSPCPYTQFANVCPSNYSYWDVGTSSTRTTNVVQCGSFTAGQSMFEFAECAFEGTCCDWTIEQNPFLRALNTITAGNCGPGTAFDVTIPPWGMTVPFIRNFYYPVFGSCYMANEPGEPRDNPFYNAVAYLLDNNMVDVGDIPQFQACRTDLEDVVPGCVVGSPCETLPVNRASDGTPYGVPQFEVGDYPPLRVCDSGTARWVRSMLSPTCARGVFVGWPCLGDWACIPGGCYTHPYTAPPAVTSVDPADVAVIDSCIADCLGGGPGNPDCARLADDSDPASYFDGTGTFYIPDAWRDFWPPDLAGQTTFSTLCSNESMCVANGCDGYNFPWKGVNYQFRCDQPNSYLSDIQLCAATRENSCSGWSVRRDPSDVPVYYDAVADAMIVSGGSCADPLFLAAVTESAREAQNQVDKMRKRHAYLLDLLNQARNITGVVENDPDDPADPVDTFDAEFPRSGGILNTGIQKFRDFLDCGSPMQYTDPDPLSLEESCGNPATPDSEWSPIEKLIRERQNWAGKSGLPSVAIYAWADETNNPADPYGLWHIVKVEARAPRRCNYTCGVGGSPDPEWPKVKTYTKAWGFKRCYKLVNTEGMVKARVVRYDESRGLGRMLRFPTGLPIWASRFSHPDREMITSAGFADPGEPCYGQVDKMFKTADQSNFLEQAPGYPYPWTQAFMLNKLPNMSVVSQATEEGYYANCWQEVHRRLNSGVSSESCAQYFFLNDSIGFSLRFVPCDAPFRRGEL